MPNSKIPKRPERPKGLSGQEEEELRALEKGYDDEASALPGRDADSGSEGERHEDGSLRPPTRAAARPLTEAERQGLLPPAGTVAPPLDHPDDEDDGPVSPAGPRRRAK
jgi:hypothetical protein